MKKELIEENINALTMALVMGSPSLLETLDVLISHISHPALLATTQKVKNALQHTLDAQQQNNLVSTYAERVLLFLAKEDSTHLAAIESLCTATGTNETKSAEHDLSSSYDASFLSEYIEKHLSMLADVEGVILDHQAVVQDLAVADQKEASVELAQYCRRYLHNIKGDSGAIGLIGLEKLFHFLEDLLDTGDVNKLSSLLLEVKTWTTEYLNALAAGNVPKDSAVKFLSSVRGHHDAAPEPTHAPSTPSVSEDYINYDLLAEVMGDTRLKESTGESKAVTVIAPVQPTAAPVNTSIPEVGTSYTIAGEADLLNDFLVESEDHLQNIESILLEQGEHINKDSLDSIFRSIHSIKGSSAYFTLREVVESAHRTESLLDEVRAGKRNFNKGFTELLLGFLDLQRKLLAEVKQASREKSAMLWKKITSDYLAALDNYATGVSPSQHDSITSEEQDKTPATTGEKVDVKSYLKIETKRLDQLLDAIGEMGIYCSMLIQTCREKLGEDAAVVKMSHQVEKVTRDVQSIGMSMRLIPIRGLFQKMSRLVWDLSRKVNKDIKFKMEGEDTEMDRSMIDRLADPLMHMIRNALDHGIESPEEREKSGKSRTGNVILRASQVGGSIHITIQDDGKGMDPAKLIKKAIEKGVISPEDRLSPQEAFQLIFAAGFSTAAVVTDISGRGVGMDVVRRNIEAMRGRVHIESVMGKGTTFTIELPLTLALIDGIEVRV